MSEEKAIVQGEQAGVPAEWGDPKEIRAMAARLDKLLPNAKDFSLDEKIMIANYCVVYGLMPVRGEVYFYKYKGRICVVDGYKALVRWADRRAPYHDWDEDLPLDKGQVAHVRVWILREDRERFVETLTRLGATWDQALDKAAKYGDGVVRELELTTRDGKENEPPTGWTWRDVARKRALKNALNLSHGAPSMKEIAEDSWKVNGVQTIEADWRHIPDHVLEQGHGADYAAMEATNRERQKTFDRLTVEQKTEQLNENSASLGRPDEDFEGFGDVPPLPDEPDSEPHEPARLVDVEPVPESEGQGPKTGPMVTVAAEVGDDWGKLARQVAETTGYYLYPGTTEVNWFHIRGTAAKLGFKVVTAKNLDNVVDALRSHAEEKQAAEQAKAEMQPALI